MGVAPRLSLVNPVYNGSVPLMVWVSNGEAFKMTYPQNRIMGAVPIKAFTVLYRYKCDKGYIFTLNTKANLTIKHIVLQV